MDPTSARREGDLNSGHLQATDQRTGCLPDLQSWIQNCSSIPYYRRYARNKPGHLNVMHILCCIVKYVMPKENLPKEKKKA